MKRIALALVVFVSLMLSSKPSFAEWVEVTENVSGDTYYIDTKIRKHDGLIYYWRLADYLKPDKSGALSTKVYHEADCGRFRHRWLQFIFYKQPMGEGNGNSSKSADQSWKSPPPGSAYEAILEAACKMAD